jgi:4-amino-4-deoxy-L-arabinose transferase-like glycosyltransferase
VPPPRPAPPIDPREEQRWRRRVAAAVGVGLAIRVISVLVRLHWPAHGDAYFYHSEANLLVEGKGWINPFLYYGPSHAHVATAAFPPLFTLVLALCSLVGLKSFLAHRLWCCIIGSSAIWLGAVVGRDLGGRRVGLIAAGLIAVYPNLWMSDGLGMSETLSPVLALLVLGAVYRMWRNPTVGKAAILGATIALAALGRDEMALLAPFLLLPLAIGARNRTWPQRLKMLVAGAAVAGALVGPWVGFNMTRFAKPVFISDGLGVTLASANCNTTWYGTFTGYWSIGCSLAADTDPRADEAVQGAHEQHVAVSYIEDHAGGLPRIEAIRLGRAFGFYRPAQQMDYDAFFDGRPKVWAWVGLIMFYGFALLAIPGARALRARGLPRWPLVAVGLDVVVSVLLTFGQTRYRSVFEPVLVLLGALAIDRFLGQRRRASEDEPPVRSGNDPFQDGRDVLVVIPALNEERSVGDVVHRAVAALPRARILVVDDGSTDSTALLARAAGAEVARAPFNLGVGGAMRIGFRYAADHGHQAVVQVDADGQHDPAEASALLAQLWRDERVHVVIGTRFGPSGEMDVPALRRLAMRALAAYATAQTGTRLDDVTSGFRAHNRAAIELFAHTYPAEYLSDTVESLVIAQRAGGHFTQVAVAMRPRTHGAPSQSTVRSATYLLRVTLILALATLRHRPKTVNQLSETKGEAWPASI